MGQKVLINVEPEDIRVAVLEEGVLTDLFVENRNEKTIVGDIYKGIVTDVIPGIQAAFVNIGYERNAFLHVQDIPPTDGDEPFRPRGRQRRSGEPDDSNGKRQNITDYLKPGQKVMVQAIKDGIGDKGPRISMFVSLPGRYLVFLPNQAEDDAGGVSRKIDDSRERSRLKKLLESFKVKGGSIILRTAAMEASDEAIQADAEFLQKSWTRIQATSHKAKAPALLHTDYDILYRLVRDVFTEEIDEICVDDTEEHKSLVKMLRQYLPNLKNRVLLYPSTRNVFEVFDIERQIYKALRKRVWLRSGGHLVIDECEALTAIDVNTGKFIGKEDQDATVLRTNLESARVIARQLRLRDIGGIIIIDFIDMRKREHREEVLRELKRCLRLDRARTTVSDITNLGIVEMTRKRVRHSLRKTLLQSCPHCGSNGMILAMDSIWRVVRNSVLTLLEDHPDHDVTIRVHPDVFQHIRAQHAGSLREIEDEHGIKVTLESHETDHEERYTLEAKSSQPDEEGEEPIIVIGKRFSGAELDEAAAASKPVRRRSRGGKRRSPERGAPDEEATEEDEDLEESDEEAVEEPEAPAAAPVATEERADPRKRRRRGRRGGRRRSHTPGDESAPEGDEELASAQGELAGIEIENIPEEIPDEVSIEEILSEEIFDEEIHADEPEPEIDPEIAAILAMESLSGPLAKRAIEPARVSVSASDESTLDAETPAEPKHDRKPRRRGSRGGRGRRRPEKSEDGSAEGKTLKAPAKPVEPTPTSDFTPVEEYLGTADVNDDSSGSPEEPASTPKKAAAKRKTGAKKAAARKKTAAKKTAAKKTTKRVSKRAASKSTDGETDSDQG